MGCKYPIYSCTYLPSLNHSLFFNTRFEGSGKDTLVVISLLGFIIFDIVYVVAVMNYAAQSEMIIHLLGAVQVLVVTKDYPDLDATIKVC